jgi:precorrin-6x reductase
MKGRGDGREIRRAQEQAPYYAATYSLAERTRSPTRSEEGTVTAERLDENVEKVVSCCEQ